MRSVFIYVLLISFIHSQAFGVSYITGDAIRSPDRSKTWLMPDTSDTLIGKETEDTLKNKTLEEPTIEDALVIKEVDAKPTPPPSGQKKIYCKDDGKCYTLDADDREKEVGSGAGGAGGINFLTDPNFEDPALTAWNPKSGLTYAADEDEALGPNVTAVCVDWDGSPNAVISQIADISTDVLGFSNVDGVNLGHKVWVKASFEGLKAEAMHLVGAGPATVANALDIPGDFKWREFDVTSVGTGSLAGVGIRIMPTDSSTGKVCFARAKVGPWDGVGTVEQARIVGTMTRTGDGTCVFGQDTSTSASDWKDFTELNTCTNAWVVEGDIVSLGGDDHQITIPNMPAGRYEFELTGMFLVHTAGTTCNFRFSDGTNNFGFAAVLSTGSSLATGGPLRGTITYTQPGTRTFKVQSSSGTGVSCSVQADTPSRRLTWTVKYYPLESEQVMRVGQGVDLMGAVLPYFTDKCPAGTIEVDGSQVPAIYQAFINRTGMSTLPNAAALVPRGIGSRTINGRTKTGPSVVGEIQEDQFQGHYHLPTNKPITQVHEVSIEPTGIQVNSFGPAVTINNGAATGSPMTDGTNGTPRVGSETRVSSFGVRWCAAVASGQQPLVKQAVIYDDVVRAEGKSGVTSIDSNLNVILTASDTTNLDDTPSVSGRYFRIGDQVEVTLAFVVDPTEAELPFSFYSTLPIPSNFTATADALGVCVATNNQGTIRVTANTTDDKFEFRGEQSNSDQFGYTCKINYVVK